MDWVDQVSLRLNPVAEVFWYRGILDSHGGGPTIWWQPAAVVQNKDVLAAGKITVNAANVNDRTGGTGVGKVLLDVIRETAPLTTYRDEIEVTISGATQDTTEADIIYVNRVLATEVGANGGAVGTVDILDKTTAALNEQILVGERMGSAAGILVPTGYQCLLAHIDARAIPPTPAEDCAIRLDTDSPLLRFDPTYQQIYVPMMSAGVDGSTLIGMQQDVHLGMEANSRLEFYVASATGITGDLTGYYAYIFMKQLSTK